MAKKKLIVPRFTSEAEDARWHDRHRQELESAVAQRIREGSVLTIQEVTARARTQPVTLRLTIQDMDKARGLAAQKGIGYQTYIKMLLHEALRREAGER
jgi:predicted DNA binding CopG/RHH family protein